MPARPVVVQAQGSMFNLIGHAAEPVRDVVLKFQAAMLLAQQKLASAYIALAHRQQLTYPQTLVIEYCFNPRPEELDTTISAVRKTLDETLKGLKTSGLNIREPNPTEMPPQAEGYVQPYGPFRGDIHTLFSLRADRTTSNLIHEATHKFCKTEDRGYIANGIDAWLALRQNPAIAGNPAFKGGAPISNRDALVNADSFAALAMKLT